MSRLTHAQNVMATDLAGGRVVMMDVDLAAYFGLEEVAAEIWRLLETPRTPEQVVEALLEKYDVEPDECRKQTLAFIDALLERKLLAAVD